MRFVPGVMRDRQFALYWTGVVFSQIGTRAAVTAMLFHVYQLSGSTAQVGLLGLSQAVALLVLSPLGGVFADQLDRRRLLQATQGLSLVIAAAIALLTAAGLAAVWQLLLASLLTTAAATFDQPARQAIIPSLVPRDRLPDAIALLNPSREVAVLAGPAVAGVLIAVAGPGLVYGFDAATYGVLVVVLAMLRLPRLPRAAVTPPVLSSLQAGFRYLRSRPIIGQLMLVDMAATVPAAYRVVLPELSLHRLHAGPVGYGLLSSAPSAGALAATGLALMAVRRRSYGRVILAVTFAYGGFVVLLGRAQVLALALGAALFIGACDAVATSLRQAAVQVETPDELRGRVTSVYQMASRGGPALGDAVVGFVAGAVGPVVALTAGGSATAAAVAGMWSRWRTVRDYDGPVRSGPAGVEPDVAVGQAPPAEA